MAKISTPAPKKTVTASKPSPKRAVVEEVDEVVEQVEEVQDEDSEVQADVEEIDPAKDLVRVSVNTEIEPAPRVGNIDMVRHFGISKLTKGIHTVPRVVATVLVDKNLAQLI